MRIACMLVAALSVPGVCGGKDDPGPSCEQLTDHLLSIMTGTVPGHAGMAMAPRQLMIQRCDEKHYAPQVRTCMMAATTMTAAGACSGEKPIAPPHPIQQRVELKPAGSGS